MYIYIQDSTILSTITIQYKTIKYMYCIYVCLYNTIQWNTCIVCMYVYDIIQYNKIQYMCCMYVFMYDNTIQYLCMLYVCIHTIQYMYCIYDYPKNNTIHVYVCMCELCIQYKTIQCKHAYIILTYMHT